MNWRLGAFLLLAPAFHAAARSTDQQTAGWCSPAVTNVDGNAQIVCHGADPKAMERLNELLIHGILHLVGYDHVNSEKEAAAMEQKSDELMKLIGKEE